MCSLEQLRHEDLVGRTATTQDKTSADGLTPLHVACIRGCLDVVHSLVELGADINLPFHGTQFHDLTDSSPSFWHHFHVRFSCLCHKEMRCPTKIHEDLGCVLATCAAGLGHMAFSISYERGDALLVLLFPRDAALARVSLVS